MDPILHRRHIQNEDNDITWTGCAFELIDRFDIRTILRAARKTGEIVRGGGA